MRIAIGCDHRGLNFKQFVIKIIAGAGHNHEDFGCYTSDLVDYPDIAKSVAEAVAGGHYEFGILICGTGVGMCIASNKVKGIRAALGHNAFSARRAREHNNANILCLAAEEGKALVPSIIETFLTTKFEGGRHQRRLDKISKMESR
ncbi:ribose 5-phosphate isomerase B [Chloroflexota bacterium]